MDGPHINLHRVVILDARPQQPSPFLGFDADSKGWERRLTAFLHVGQVQEKGENALTTSQMLLPTEK